MKRNIKYAIAAGALALGFAAWQASGLFMRDHVTSDYAPALEAEDPQVVRISDEASAALKRGFADFNGDGLEDMVEIRDTDWVGQNWEAQVFYGHEVDGNLSFKDPVKVDIPVDAKYFTSQLKFDTGDLNGDGFADIVLTQYREGLFGKDSVYVVAAMNDQNGNFVATDRVRMGKSMIGVRLYELMESIASESDQEISSIDDILRMDWADANGDGKDDLFIFTPGYSGMIRGWSDLEVTTWYSKTPENELETVTFGGESSTTIPYFLYNVEMGSIDTADINGDNKADVVAYDDWTGRRLDISVALSDSDWDGLSFTGHKDTITDETDFDTQYMGGVSEYMNFSKRDSFDANLDGKDDYVHVGTISGKPSLSYISLKDAE
jgi:hypothetical protein